ncbi:DcrB-related protein [Paracoccus methylarcula]|uniref:DUF1795 domain-containing protein n=1 Tax=Paracoccus methylarcula TaxID=72022 RepID=A0A422QX33_9RHOB|nr:DUF1795 domain-containing protein [Paracoccus methylarcula]
MYRINEGMFDLPEGWRDRTVNVIASDNSPTQMALTITRDDRAWGVSFPEYLEDQMKRVSNALEGFELLGRREFHLSGLPAHEMEGRWMRSNTPVHMLSTIIDTGERALIFTASTDGQMSPGQKFEMRRIVESFRVMPG